MTSLASFFFALSGNEYLFLGIGMLKHVARLRAGKVPKGSAIWL
jgi:hypothetical protein